MTPRDVILLALTEWKLRDQPDKPRAVIERWAAWYLDTEFASGETQPDLEGLRAAIKTALQALDQVECVSTPLAFAEVTLRAALYPRPEPWEVAAMIEYGDDHSDDPPDPARLIEGEKP